MQNEPVQSLAAVTIDSDHPALSVLPRVESTMTAAGVLNCLACVKNLVQNLPKICLLLICSVGVIGFMP